MSVVERLINEFLRFAYEHTCDDIEVVDEVRSPLDFDGESFDVQHTDLIQSRCRSPSNNRNSPSNNKTLLDRVQAIRYYKF